MPLESCCSYTRRPMLTMMVGLPRSGKTTYVNAHFKGSDPILCADQLRYLVYGQRFWGDGEELMWSIHKKVLTMLLEQGIDVVIDETNTTEARRQPLIKLARKYGYSVRAIVISTPADVCIARAKAENDTVIIPVIERMEAQYEPIVDEDYDWVVRWPNPLSK
jgi:predicted kinase